MATLHDINASAAPSSHAGGHAGHGHDSDDDDDDSEGNGEPQNYFAGGERRCVFSIQTRPCMRRS